jgi:hypothetical protein
VRFNEEVDWPRALGEHIAKPSLATAGNIATMVLLEAGLREVEDQLAGRGRYPAEDLGWARITRRLVVKRAKRIAQTELTEPVNVGEGAFKYRWPGLGGMADYFMCLVSYSLNAPRWRAAFESGPRRALAELPEVASGRKELADLITRIATHDLRVRIRLAKYWLFQLSLTIDARWKAMANKAHRQYLQNYADRWVPVYEEGLRQLRVRFRPGMTADKLDAMVSALIAGFAEHAAGTGDEVYLYGEDCATLFAEAVQSLIYAAIDPGDGVPIGQALHNIVARSE